MAQERIHGTGYMKKGVGKRGEEERWERIHRETPWVSSTREVHEEQIHGNKYVEFTGMIKRQQAWKWLNIT